MNVELLRYPNDDDWKEVKRRALVTVGKDANLNVPSYNWKEKILKARHSPIRYLQFSFLLEDVPYFVSVHLCRHIHAQPYVRSQRNDRQNEYDRNAARQDHPVTMIWDMNAEELITIANKRLCNLASVETREIVRAMCDKVVTACPEFKSQLVPNCVRNGGVCHEMFPCKKGLEYGEQPE